MVCLGRGVKGTGWWVVGMESVSHAVNELGKVRLTLRCGRRGAELRSCGAMTAIDTAHAMLSEVEGREGLRKLISDKPAKSVTSYSYLITFVQRTPYSPPNHDSKV